MTIVNNSNEWFESFYRRICYGQEHRNYVLLENDNPLIITVMLGWKNLSFSFDDVYILIRSTKTSSIILTREYKGDPEDLDKAYSSALAEVYGDNANSLILMPDSTAESILKLDDIVNPTKFKFGVIYVNGQMSNKNDMEIFENKKASKSFNQFLKLIGVKTKLKEFAGYSGGLDTTSDKTGIYSVYKKYQDVQIMFHVSTLLPNEYIQTKRHIGNDIVTIVFLDEDAPKFSSSCIQSHFLQIFIVIKRLEDKFIVNIISNEMIPAFDPPIPKPPIFSAEELEQFLIRKSKIDLISVAW